MTIEAAGMSDAGCVRPNNEDSFAIVPEHSLYIVADGMGGAQAGEHASRMAVDAVIDYVERCDHANGETLPHAFEEANRRVMAAAAADANLEGMGTTLVAALSNGTDLMIASVGDSRAYVYDVFGLSAITEDQTWVQEVGRRLGIDDDSLKTHPMRHVLTMAIGVSSPLRVHAYAISPDPGTQILLCSDGLHGVVDADTISDTLSTPGALEDKCRALIQAARAAGAPDNVTVLLLRAVGDSSRTRTSA
jgi:serine/threonine protein phosphatase PrpC